MKAALVESDVVALAAGLRDAHQAYVAADERVRRTEQSLESFREVVARRRLELGRMLITARERWPASGPRAKGWGDLLERAGIDQDVALTAMKYAGFVVESFPGGEPVNLPTLREAGLVSEPDDRDDRGDRPALRLVPDEPPPAEVGPEVEIDRDTWCTPRWMTDVIGKFDLDPCSNDRSHVKSQYTYDLARGEDGLVLASEVPARYRVFINPPYSNVRPWVDAYKHARFCFLLKYDPSTKWCRELMKHTAAVLFPIGTRIEFEPPPGVPASSNQFPHALFYAREEDATAAIKRLCFVLRKVE